MGTKNGNGKKTKAKQTTIPGTERDVPADLREAAEAYREVRNNRMELTEQETEAQEELNAKMAKKNVEQFVYEDDEGEKQLVTRKPTEIKVSVRKFREPKPRTSKDGGAAGAEG